MSYTVNWITKVISVPTTDLTPISGTRYSLDMADFLTEVRRLEWEPTEGLWAPPILDHTNTRFDFAGVNYAPFDDLLNGYTIQFTGVATRVDLLGSNNDIVDVLIPTGVSIVPSNSAGLQIVSSGSGVTEQDKLDIADRVWDEVAANHLTIGTTGKLIDDVSYTDKWVYVDTELITNGDGKSSNPFNNFPDAVDYAESIGWRRIFLRSDATLDRTLKNFSIEGIGLPTIDFNGQNVDKSEFLKVKLTGQQVGVVTGREVVLLAGLTGVNGIYKDFGLAGDIEMADNSYTTFASCSSLFSTSPSPFVIDMGAATTNVILNVRKMSGAILIQNVNTVTKIATFEFSGGKIIADNTNTAGVLGVAGLPDSAVHIDDATSTKIVEGLFPSKESNADAVWNKVLPEP